MNRSAPTCQTARLPALLRLAAAVALALAMPASAAETAASANANSQGNASPAGSVPTIFRAADLALGARLLQANRCSECHVRKVGGDGNGIYNPKGRISTPAALRGMVDLCSTELNLQLFPDEVTAVAAVLNRDHYRFAGR